MTTPLEIHLARRDEASADRAYRIIRAARKVSALTGKWASKLVFHTSTSHMRYIPSALAMKSSGMGAWSLSVAGNPLKPTVPLTDLIDPITKPVSIVASGPSALDHDWNDLRGGRRFVIAVNGSTTILAQAGIKPDLMVVIDDKFCVSGARHFAAAAGVPLVIESIAGATWAALAPDDFNSRTVSFLERVNAWYAIPKVSAAELARLNDESGRPWALPEKMDANFRVGWSARPEWGFFSGRTVTFAALQVAVRLGGRDIEIIGMDLGGKGRAYQEPVNARPSYLEAHYAEYVLPSFQLMARALANTGVRVSNLSPVCPLPREIFEP